MHFSDQFSWIFRLFSAFFHWKLRFLTNFIGFSGIFRLFFTEKCTFLTNFLGFSCNFSPFWSKTEDFRSIFGWFPLKMQFSGANLLVFSVVFHRKMQFSSNFSQKIHTHQVHQIVWRRNIHTMPFQSEHNRRYNTRFCGKRWPKNFMIRRVPCATCQLLNDLYNAWAGSFRDSNKNLHQIRLWVDPDGVLHPRSNLMRPLNLFQHWEPELHGKPRGEPENHVERWIEHQVPDDGAEEYVGVLFERWDDGLAEQKTGEEAAGERHEHTGEPAWEWVLTGEWDGVWSQVVADGEAGLQDLSCFSVKIYWKIAFFDFFTKKIGSFLAFLLKIDKFLSRKSDFSGVFINTNSRISSFFRAVFCKKFEFPSFYAIFPSKSHIFYQHINLTNT